MKAVKLSTIIICFLFFITLPLASENIICKKYTGTYKDYQCTVTFSQKGKMLIEVDDRNGGGYFSTPGSYIVKNKKIDFFFRGLNRTLYIDKDRLTASPYTFSIDEDYKTEIVLLEDIQYSKSCK